MRKFLTIFLICIFSLIFFLSVKSYKSLYTFNTSNVINTIDFLSDEHFKGRLTGTIENREVEEYIRLKFIENDLKPFLGNYEQTFKVSYPCKIKGNPYLTVTDSNGKIVKEFIYGKDFKEDMLNFKSNKVTFNKNNPSTLESKKSIQIKQNSNNYLFYIPSNNSLKFRSSFISNDPWSMCIMVSKNTLSKLKEYLNKDYNINCFIPFVNKKTTCKNIFGYIEGKDSSSDPIIISAHFDHLGEDLNGNVYSGALDNASGTAFILEMMKYIKSLGVPDRNILFVGFNAEEFGCLGSAQFVSKYKNYIKESKVFNFDMIGSDIGVPLCIMGSKSDTIKNTLINSASNTCTNENIYFNYLFQDASDHKAFRQNKIDAITFCDNDTKRIHTPYDTIKFISPSAIKRCYNVASKEIIKYAYTQKPIIFYYKQGIILSLAGIVLISLISYKKR